MAGIYTLYTPITVAEGPGGAVKSVNKPALYLRYIHGTPFVSLIRPGPIGAYVASETEWYGLAKQL